MKYFIKLVLLACVGFFSFEVQAQPGSAVELKKPARYEKRKLGSERTATKKFGATRHFYQNLVTHYNYFFNASNKLNDIVGRAKLSFKDDYTQLLPFYNYSLTATAQETSEIDSIIYKCTAGVLLHDLRNDWIDNLYLLLGKAYFFRQNFDSAGMAFQYINYAFAPKDEGYDIAIGSNASNTNGVFSVSTVEKNDLLHKIASHPPSRNNAFLWQARNYMESDRLAEAAGLLEVVRHDPNFPERLHTDLSETIAYWYYKQKAYDSAAWHLDKSLDNASNKFERARWEFLIAQMYQLSNKNEEALKYYNRCIEHTPDVVMEVYANLNSIAITNGDKDDVLLEKLNNLLKLGRREKYTTYRDIIYYAAAQVEMERTNIIGARQLLKKSIANSSENLIQRSLSFLLLADITYGSKSFVQAGNYYDSIEVSVITNPADVDRITLRQTALKTISDNITAVHNEDSLQHVAAMPEAEREAYLKKALRKLRKAQGLKEDADAQPSENPAVQLETKADLFNAAAKGDWYFNNNQLKSTGFTEFKQRWGSRPNVDNWRRQSEIDKISEPKNQEELANEDAVPEGETTAITDASTTDDLAAALPLTEEKLQKSNDNIAKAIFNKGKTFQNELENYEAAIDAYNELNNRFPQNSYKEESLFNLYYCYSKSGDKQRADSCLTALKTTYPDSKFVKTLGAPNVPLTSNTNPATKEYENIYNLFIEGKFDEAKAGKVKADSIYGATYWTPQLLYIESIYYVSVKEDSVAINRLSDLAEMHASSPLAAKAKTMIDVLKRRKEIENYLTSLQITRDEDEVTANTNLNPVEPNINAPIKKVDSIVSKPVTNKVAIKVDTTAAAPVTIKTFTYNPAQPQFVLILLDKVAPVFANEAKNAFNRFNKEKYYNQKIDITSVKLDDRYNLVLIGPFTDALAATDYVDKTKPLTTGRILPWLTPDKYSYTIISQDNLDLLKDNKDVDGYHKLVQKVLPGKF